MINHPLLPYVYKKCRPIYAWGFLAVSIWAASRKSSSEILALSNPVSDDLAHTYFHEYYKELSIPSKTSGHVRDMIARARQYAQRDDQLKFYLQLLRFKFYASQISMIKLSDYKKARPYLKVIANDLQKFKREDTIQAFDDRDKSIKQMFLNAYNDEDNYIKKRSYLVGFCNRIERHAQELENNVRHYLDLMYNNARFASLKEISWNKTAHELIPMLSKKHDEIVDKMSGSELITAVPVDSTDFITINNNLKWVLINDNFCPYEQEIMGHCATAPRGCFLISLREYSTTWPRKEKATGIIKDFDIKSPVWLSRVTATLCPVAPNKKTKASSKVKYSISEILGPKNMRVDEKWTKAIKALYEHPDIIEELENSTNAFMTKDLDIENKKTLYKKKPKLAPASWAIEKATDKGLIKIFLKELQSFSKTGYDMLNTSMKYKKDGHILILENEDTKEFFDKVDYFNSRSDSEIIDRVVEAYNDPWTWTENNYHDYYPSWNDIDKTTYFKLMSKTQLIKALNTTDYKSVLVSDVPDELKEAMRNAEADGYKTGYENEISSYAYQVLKEAKFTDNAGVDSAFVDHNNGKWQLWILADDLRRGMKATIDDDTNPVTYILDELKIEKPDRWRIDGGFDNDTSVERFKELVYEEYGE